MVMICCKQLTNCGVVSSTSVASSSELLQQEYMSR